MARNRNIIFGFCLLALPLVAQDKPGPMPLDEIFLLHYLGWIKEAERTNQQPGKIVVHYGAQPLNNAAISAEYLRHFFPEEHGDLKATQLNEFSMRRVHAQGRQKIDEALKDLKFGKRYNISEPNFVSEYDFDKHQFTLTGIDMDSKMTYSFRFQNEMVLSWDRMLPPIDLTVRVGSGQRGLRQPIIKMGFDEAEAFVNQLEGPNGRRVFLNLVYSVKPKRSERLVTVGSPLTIRPWQIRIHSAALYKDEALTDELYAFPEGAAFGMYRIEGEGGMVTTAGVSDATVADASTSVPGMPAYVRNYPSPSDEPRFAVTYAGDLGGAKFHRRIPFHNLEMELTYEMLSDQGQKLYFDPTNERYGRVAVEILNNDKILTFKARLNQLKTVEETVGGKVRSVYRFTLGPLFQRMAATDHVLEIRPGQKDHLHVTWRNGRNRALHDFILSPKVGEMGLWEQPFSRSR